MSAEKWVVCVVSLMVSAFALSACTNQADRASLPASEDHTSAGSERGGRVSAEPSASSTVQMVAEEVWYETLEQMAANSVAVVTFELLETEYGLVYPDWSSDDPMINPYAGTDFTPSREETAGRPGTFHHVRVVSVAAGDLSPGDEIVILEAGGEVDGVMYEAVGRPELTEVELLFLDATSEDRYVILGSQARFASDGEGGYRSLVSPELQITPDDLDELAELIHS